MHVLIVDYDQLSVAMIKHMLQSMGHTSGHAASEKGGILMAGQVVWDACIVDWWLKPEAPGGGGPVAAACAEAGIPCVLATGYPDCGFMEASAALAPLGVLCVVKPFRWEPVIIALEKLSGDAA